MFAAHAVVGYAVESLCRVCLALRNIAQPGHDSLDTAVVLRMNGEAISLEQQRELVAECKAKVQSHCVSSAFLSRWFKAVSWSSQFLPLLTLRSLFGCCTAACGDGADIL